MFILESRFKNSLMFSIPEVEFSDLSSMLSLIAWEMRSLSLIMNLILQKSWLNLSTIWWKWNIELLRSKVIIYTLTLFRFPFTWLVPTWHSDFWWISDTSSCWFFKQEYLPCYHSIHKNGSQVFQLFRLCITVQTIRIGISASHIRQTCDICIPSIISSTYACAGPNDFRLVNSYECWACWSIKRARS